MDRQQNLYIQAWFLVFFIFFVNCVFAFLMAFAVHGQIPSQVLDEALTAFGVLSLAILGLALGFATVTKTEILNKTERLISKYLWKQKYRSRFLSIMRIKY